MEPTRVSHYDVLRSLGRGGMGEVVEALDSNLDRRVALKFIAAELAADPDSLRRFEREARAAAALNHPNIAVVYAFERAPRPFIAMELLAGPTLRARLREGLLPLEQALAIARDTASALAFAHQRGIVHRDVKPENLMFDSHGAPRLMDFGLARAAQASRMTMTGAAVGTAAYMAPEAITGSSAPSVDVFSLGVLLHEMISGELPFTGEGPLALMYAISNLEPKSLRATRPDVPEAVDALVRRLLEKDPAQRPDAAAAARELAKLSGQSASAYGSQDAGARDASGAPARVITEDLEVERLRRASHGDHGALAPRTPVPGSRRARVIGVLVLVAVLGGGTLGAFRLLRSRHENRYARAIVHNDRGAAMLMRGSLDSAAVELDAALALDPTYAMAQLNRGRLHHAQHDDEHAAQLYRTALAGSARDPKTRALAYNSLADLDLEAGAWSSAAGLYAASLAQDSSSALPYNQLGWSLLRAGRPDTARVVLEHAVRRFGGEPVLWKNLALAALDLQDSDGAIAAADRALELRDPPAVVFAARARAWARKHDAAKARADWARYLAANPDAAERDAIERELRDLGILN